MLTPTPTQVHAQPSVTGALDMAYWKVLLGANQGHRQSDTFYVLESESTHLVQTLNPGRNGLTTSFRTHWEDVEPVNSFSQGIADQ